MQDFFRDDPRQHPPANGLELRNEQGTKAAGTARRFEILANEWHEHCERNRYDCDMMGYFAHPSFRHLVGLGMPAVPYIMDRYKTDRILYWCFVLQEITRIKEMAEDPRDFNAVEARRRWIEWWEKSQHEKR
jgi:hypothetical protein